MLIEHMKNHELFLHEVGWDARARQLREKAATLHEDSIERGVLRATARDCDDAVAEVQAEIKRRGLR
jgi:hypothetical protein